MSGSGWTEARRTSKVVGCDAVDNDRCGGHGAWRWNIEVEKASRVSPALKLLFSEPRQDLILENTFGTHQPTVWLTQQGGISHLWLADWSSWAVTSSADYGDGKAINCLEFIKWAKLITKGLNHCGNFSIVQNPFWESWHDMTVLHSTYSTACC